MKRNTVIYHPSMSNHLQVKIAYHDGSPVVDTVNKVKISRSTNWNGANSTSEEYTLDSNGMIYVKYNAGNDSGVYFFVS